MEFQTEWNRKSEPTNSGDPYKPQYIESIDKKGHRYLKPNGKKNIHEMIQAELNDVKVYTIIDKYLQTGDESLLNKRKGMFADFSNIPTGRNELNAIIMEAESKFNQLDKDVRAEFHNDVNEFKNAILNEQFEDRVAHFIGQKTKAEKVAEIEKKMKESEVKKGE